MLQNPFRENLASTMPIECTPHSSVAGRQQNPYEQVVRKRTVRTGCRAGLSRRKGIRCGRPKGADGLKSAAALDRHSPGTPLADAADQGNMRHTRGVSQRDGAVSKTHPFKLQQKSGGHARPSWSLLGRHLARRFAPHRWIPPVSRSPAAAGRPESPAGGLTDFGIVTRPIP
jgi:hypothetical protein